VTHLILFILTVALPIGSAPVTTDTTNESVRFTTVGVYVDSGETPLAAYQIEFTATVGEVRIVGIEGGEHPAFSVPPYYDPMAIQQRRVVLASFNTADADELPVGKTRIATIHLQVMGQTPPQYQTDLTVAADTEGKPIQAAVEIQEQAP